MSDLRTQRYQGLPPQGQATVQETASRRRQRPEARVQQGASATFPVVQPEAEAAAEVTAEAHAAAEASAVAVAASEAVARAEAEDVKQV